jgi:hypothetical protein
MQAALVEYPAVTEPLRIVAQAVCGDCRYAQLFALQPRAVCTHPWAPERGKVLPANQPACERMTPVTKEPITLHAYARNTHPLR